MNKTEIMNKATKAFYKVGFTLKKHSPEILVVAGCWHCCERCAGLPRYDKSK